MTRTFTLLSAFILLLTATVRADDDARLSALVRQPAGALFRISRAAGKYVMGDPASHFNNLADPKGVSFDVSNNRMLANHGPQGTLLSLTSYRDSYITLTPGWPGVWACKDNTTTGSYSFTLEIAGQKIDLANLNDDCETTLIDNLIPQTLIKPAGKPLQFRTLTFAPITADGSRRPSAIIYALEIENRGQQELTCKVILPKLKAGTGPYAGWAQSDTHSGPDMALFGRDFTAEVPVSIPPGQSRWTAAIFYVPGEDAVAEINAHPLDWWFSQSLQYYRSILGRLQTPDKPFLGQFYERQMMQCLQSIAMGPAGRIAGSNWGSVPPTRMIWTKDCYYSCIGVLPAEPALAEKLIAWFDANGVRPKATHARSDQPNCTESGGVSHSISLSVAAPIMASLYYETTGDAGIFSRHPEWKSHWAAILDQILASRKFPDVCLFPTAYISDGPVKGDFHTGSNICLWKALTGYARLANEIWRDPQTAARYNAIAAELKSAILSHNVIDGPAGKCLIEASNHGATRPRVESDGEESDTTLAPLYGFLDVNDPLYLGTMKFAMSPANVSYTPALNAISWETSVPSTSPGYNKGLAAAITADDCWGQQGHYTELARVTDADGSVWWWTYGSGKKFDPDKPIRAYNGIGKAGWTSGVYTNLYRSRMIGVRYDAPAQTLRLAPMSALGRFTWTGMPAGAQRFNLSFDPATGAAVNNPTSKILHIELILPEKRWALSGQALPGQPLVHLGVPSTLLKFDLPPGQTAQITP